jgi:chromosome segregation ATPase
VQAPKKATPKLADTSKLESAIEKTKQYGSYDDQMGKYNDLANQIKDRQTEKANKAKELADRQKSFNTDLAKMQAEQKAKVASINTDYANRIKSFNAETSAEIKNRQNDIKNTKDKNERAQKQADLNNYQKDRNNDLANINKDKTNDINGTVNDINNFKNDFNNYKNEVSSFNKDIDSKISQAAKDQSAAQNAAKFAKQREGQEKQLDQIKSSNQSLIDKANSDYESGMSKYNEYQNSLKDEKSKWEEETGRKATGIQSVRPQTTTKTLGGADNAAQNF